MRRKREVEKGRKGVERREGGQRERWWNRREIEWEGERESEKKRR